MVVLAAREVEQAGPAPPAVEPAVDDEEIVADEDEDSVGSHRLRRRASYQGARSSSPAPVLASDAADEHSSADAVRRRSRARGSPKPPPPELRRTSSRFRPQQPDAGACRHGHQGLPVSTNGRAALWMKTPDRRWAPSRPDVGVGGLRIRACGRRARRR